MDGLVAIAGQPLKDRSARGIGQSLEDMISRVSHRKTITEWLWFVKTEAQFFF
jgi:hypothetical protein